MSERTDYKTGKVARECPCGKTFYVPWESYKKRNCSRACGYEYRVLPQTLDLTGEKYGRLTVVGEGDRTASGKRQWLTECDCGGSRTVTTQDLRRSDNKRIQHCESAEHWRGNESPRWSGGSYLSGSKWGAIKRSARVRNLAFEVTLEYVERLIEDQNWKCALSGKKIDRTTMSLDRINSGNGYVEGNVQWLHWHVNRAKMDLSQEDFLALCQEVANYVD